MKIIHNDLRMVLRNISLSIGGTCFTNILRNLDFYPKKLLNCLNFLEYKKLIVRSVKNKSNKRMIRITVKGYKVSKRLNEIHRLIT